MKIKSILIAANNYPTKTDPVYTFLEQLVIAIAKRDIKVTVIAPERIVQHVLRHTELHPKRRVIKIDGGTDVTIIQPRYITLGGKHEKFNLWSAQRAVCKAAKTLKEKPDVCYGHFWHWVYSIYPFAKKHKIPLFANTSETPIILQDLRQIDSLNDFVNTVKGVVCASSFCRDQSVEKGLATKDKCFVIPNAINNELFYRKDKRTLRREHGFSDDDFIVAYTGWYNTNKGIDRVSKAITQLNDSQVKSFFIGGNRGDGIQPTCDGVLHSGRLPHEEIPDWLNMADVFVLPTLAEGCCNSIIEAMACGLPIVSSNLPFNWDVLNDRNSIMVDPMNVNEISSAIADLKSNKNKREAMSNAALETAKALTIEKRAEKIISFIESRI